MLLVMKALNRDDGLSFFMPLWDTPFLLFLGVGWSGGGVFAFIFLPCPSPEEGASASTAVLECLVVLGEGCAASLEGG